jgi:phospholipid/cholesterol/gamma-HCH transport system substrate-binding protein
MANSHVKLKVGIAFVLALAVFFTGVLWLKEYTPSVKTVRVRVVFESSDGIAAGDPVTVSGIRVGEVTRVTLTPENRALVEFRIARSVILHPDASFGIRDISIMGEKALVVEPGFRSGTLDTSTVLTGSQAAGLNRLFDEAQTLVGHLSAVVARVDSGFDAAKLSASLDQTLRKVSETASAYRTLAGEVRGPLAGAIGKVGAASDSVSGFVRDRGGDAARSLESVRVASDRLTALVDSLGSASRSISSITARIDSGGGSLAKLVRSDSLYEELRHTNAAVDSFITDFRRDPGKFTKDMKFRVRLF